MVVHKASACGYQGQVCDRDRWSAKGIVHSQCRLCEAWGGYKQLKQADRSNGGACWSCPTRKGSFRISIHVTTFCEALVFCAFFA